MACNEEKPNCLKDLPHNGPKIYLKVSKQESPYKRRQESPYNRIWTTKKAQIMELGPKKDIEKLIHRNRECDSCEERNPLQKFLKSGDWSKTQKGRPTPRGQALVESRYQIIIPCSFS